MINARLIQQLLVFVSVGAAIFFAYLQFPIFYVMAFLLFAIIMMKDVRSIRAKSGDKEFQAEFGDVKSKSLERRDEEAARRLRETNQGSASLRPGGQENDESEASET